MHIPEGVLSPAVIGGGFALTAAGTAIGLRKADYARLTTTAVLAAAFFVGSLVHVPLALGNVHLMLNGLLGLFLGWTVFPALLVALALQAVLFEYGGFAALGANTFDMALPALIGHYAFRPLIAWPGRWRMVGAFACGAFSVAGAGLLYAAAFLLSDDRLSAPAYAVLAAHLPIMALEGGITAAAVRFIAKARPELLRFGHDDMGGIRP